MLIDIEDTGLVQTLLEAFRRGERYQPIASDPPIDLDRAYAIQRAFTDLRSADEPIAGYKAAANAAALQQALQLDGPITGVLFAGGAVAAGGTAARNGYRLLLIETELGFRTRAPITAPVRDLATLKDLMATVAPMFELADPGYGRVAIRGTDLVAANSASAGFVEGARVSLAACDPNQIPVRLTRDEVLLHEAEAVDLMGDQWQALLWLVNEVVAQGRVIEAGALLMTGALGAAHPGEPGLYRAEFGPLGTLTLTVE